MTERPIPYQSAMVRAVLDGLKLQTRRLVKASAPPEATSAGVFFAPGRAYDAEWIWLSGDPKDCDSWSSVGKPFRCPYGQPGDRLWVREAWRTIAPYNSRAPRDLPHNSAIHYEADHSVVNGPMGRDSGGRLRPGMFMPRWASRITLEVTGVRMERLQDISEADAQAEGIEPLPPPSPPHAWSGPNRFTLKGMGNGPCAGSISWNGPTAVGLYRRLWEQINGPGSWAVNPWVWVVEFRRLP